MKILLTGPIPPHPGGGAISRAQLAAAFVALGRSVTVLAPLAAGSEAEAARFDRLHPELRIERYPVPHFERTPFRPPPTDFFQAEKRGIEERFDRVVEEIGPDLVVIGRETFARYLPPLVEAAGLPSVLLVRGSPTGHILRGEYPEEETRKLLDQFRRVDRIIAVADYLRDGLRGLGVSNVVCIPNAIDVRQFAPRSPDPRLRARLAIGPEQRVVLVPANLHPRKRPYDVLDAAERALARDSGLVFVMAGTGLLREAVEKQARRRGLSASFRFTGWLPYSLMPDLMSLAHAVVLASEAEGMSRACLEAMACERVLIASDIPPAREIVEDGRTGLLFPLGDADALADRIVEAVRDQARARRMGSQARESVAWRSIDQIAPLYIEQFETAVRAHCEAASGCGVRRR